MNTKDKVLALLVNDKTVSGEKLASLCGVSRAAIWKAVNAMRSEGIQSYEILSSFSVPQILV